MREKTKSQETSVFSLVWRFWSFFVCLTRLWRVGDPRTLKVSRERLHGGPFFLACNVYRNRRERYDSQYPGTPAASRVAGRAREQGGGCSRVACLTIAVQPLVTRLRGGGGSVIPTVPEVGDAIGDAFGVGDASAVFFGWCLVVL